MNIDLWTSVDIVAIVLFMFSGATQDINLATFSLVLAMFAEQKK